MTGEDFEIALIQLGLKSPSKAARLFKVSQRTIFHWKRHGLDEGAGGAQAVMACAVRILLLLPREQVKTVVASLVKQIPTPKESER